MRTRSPTSTAYLRFMILPCARRGRSWTVSCAVRAAMTGVVHRLSVGRSGGAAHAGSEVVLLVVHTTVQLVLVSLYIRTCAC